MKGLIETWDVLKCSWLVFFCRLNAINRNMGCIEIKTMEHMGKCCGINRNMGCIEIPLPSP